MRRHGVGREHPPHQGEGGQVEDRTDRPEAQHEAANVAGVPFQGGRHQILVDTVERDADLREVVEQVLHQQVQRQHRQERQEGAGHQHRQHVAEVGAGRHADVLQQVAEGGAALHHAFVQHHQALLQQDDVGRLLGDVHGRIHRDAQVGRAQRRRVVDAVAHEAHHMALGAQRAHDALFVQRAQLGEDLVRLDCRGQFGIAHGLHLVAQQRLPLWQAHLGAHLRSHLRVVAREHLDRHPMGRQGAQGWGGRFLGWIQKGDVAHQHQVGLIGHAVDRLLGRQLLHRDRHDAQSAERQPGADLLHALAHRVVQRRVVGFLLLRVPGQPHACAHREHLLQRALADQLVVLLAVAPFGHHHRHPVALEVKGDLVDLAVAFVQLQFNGQFHVVQHGPVQQVLEAALVVTVQESEGQHLVRGLAQRVDVLGQRDLVLGQGAGLVGAQHVHRAQVLDRVQPLDHDLAARQVHGAPGQGGGHDHGQHLGRQAHGHRQRKEEGLHPVALREAVDQQHHRHHDGGKPDEQPAHAVDARLEGVGAGVGGRGMRRHRAEEAARPGVDHQRRGGA